MKEYEFEIKLLCTAKDNGDYALNVHMPNSVVTLFFKSFRRAIQVKRIIEFEKGVAHITPTTDKVEVIRCKDCTGINALITRPEGRLFCERIGHWVYDLDFCSFAERKSEQ